jgi:energy-coupling factor transporter ATP-binding protein EcfA2
MAAVFVSHSSRDRALTEWVLERLKAAGFAALFIDFDPEQGIPAGRNWERELYAQLRRTDAVIFLASTASVASQWCFAELSLARSLGRPVFPLRLQPGVGLPLLADVQWVDLTDAEPRLARLLAGLRSAGLDPTDSFAWDPHRSPYPGLVPFAPEDAAVFFGRQPETGRLVELLTPTLQRGPGRLVAVVGPSGSGKSSLLHAGLLPRLARSPERWLVLPPLRPGHQPSVALANCLARAFATRSRPRPADELAAALQRGSAGLVELATELAELAGDGVGRPSLLVVIDQAEELLTRTGAREQQAFLRLLDGALHEDSPVWAVATVRSEFLSTAPDRAGLAEAVDDPLVIEPLSRARLAEVIARPAQRAGLEFAPGLVERMVEDTAGGTHSRCSATPCTSFTSEPAQLATSPRPTTTRWAE